MNIYINQPQNLDVIKAMDELTNKISGIDTSIKSLPVPVINIEPTPIENIIENKIDVNPTPVENKIEVITPKLKSSTNTKRIARDGSNNIDGTIDTTEYEYEK